MSFLVTARIALIVFSECGNLPLAMPFLNSPWIVIFLIVGIGKGSNLAGLNLERNAIGEPFGYFAGLLEGIHEIHE